jgi:membrane protease YdiL (CAAX protease family)
MFIEFSLSVVGISFLLGFVGTILWKKDSTQWKTFLFFYTFLPAMICIVVFFVITNTWSLGDFSFTKFDFRYTALGLLIPIVFQSINLLVQLQRSSYAFKAGTDLKKVIPIILVNVAVLILFVSGEEIGWRGFIQSQAIERYGSIVGVLLLGLVWGFWHAPVALRGHNLNAYFWAEAFVLYPYMCICYSFPMAFLTLQSGSIWPAILFHAANNALGSINIQFVDKKNPKLEILIQMVIATLFLLPFAFFLV